MTAIKGSIFDQMLRGAMQGEDLNPKALKRAFYGLPDGVRKALWRDELPEMEKLVDNLNKDPQKMLRQGLKLGAGAVTAFGVYRAYHSHDPLTVLVGAAGLHFAPKLMANPDVLKAVSGFVEKHTRGASKQTLAAAASQVMTAVHAAQRAQAENTDK